MPLRIHASALVLILLASVGAADALATASSSDEAPPAAGAGIAPITREAFEEMLDASIEEKGGAKLEQGDTLRVEPAAEAKVLFFTRPGHRAHPGIVVVRIVEQDGRPGLETTGWWAGDAEAFEDWFRVFARHNERLSREWQAEESD